LQEALQLRVVHVFERYDVRTGQPAPIVDRRVIERVAENNIAGLRNRRHERQVRGEAGWSYQRSLGVAKFGHLLLQHALFGENSGLQRTSERGYERLLLAGSDHSRVVVQPMVVVRLQEECRLQLAFRARAAAEHNLVVGTILVDIEVMHADARCLHFLELSTESGDASFLWCRPFRNEASNNCSRICYNFLFGFLRGCFCHCGGSCCC